MYNRSTEELFLLIKGLHRSEKRSFHLYARRNVPGQNLKVVKLFEILNQMEDYNENLVLQKLKNVTERQLPGLKASLYELILDCLRIYYKRKSIDLQLHQLMDHARVLHDKGYWLQSLKLLRKMKAHAKRFHQVSYLFQALALERKILLFTGKFIKEELESLTKELSHYNEELYLIGKLSNACLTFYTYYQQFGTMVQVNSKVKLEKLFFSFSNIHIDSSCFYARLYFIQSNAYYYLINQEWKEFHSYTQKWVALFKEFPHMQRVEQKQYETGVYYLSEVALFQHLTGINNCVKDPFISLFISINQLLLSGQQSLGELYEIEKSGYILKSNTYKLLFYTKAAQFCINCQEFKKALDFINPALSIKDHIRLDLQLRLRKMNVFVHERLGNEKLLEYLNLNLIRFEKKVQAYVNNDDDLYLDTFTPINSFLFAN